MEINRERGKRVIAHEPTGRDSEECTVEELQETMLSTIREKHPDQIDNIVHWTIYSSRDWDGECNNLCIVAYRWETDGEMALRIEQATKYAIEEERIEKLQQAQKVEDMKIAEKQEYELYKKLAEKYKDK